MAQTAVRTLQPDLIIVDSELPGGSGVTVLLLWRLRSSLVTSLTPVVAIGGEGRPRKRCCAPAHSRYSRALSGEQALDRAVRQALNTTLAPEGAPSQALEQPERLRAVAASGLLDPAPHATFDVLTGIAATLPVFGRGEVEVA